MRGGSTPEEDELWAKSLGVFESEIETLAGNPVSTVEAAAREIPGLLSGESDFWRQIRDEGILLLGVPLQELSEP